MKYKSYTSEVLEKEDKRNRREKIIRQIISFLDIEFPNEEIHSTEYRTERSTLLCNINGVYVYKTTALYHGAILTGVHISAVGLYDSEINRVCIVHNYNISK